MNGAKKSKVDELGVECELGDEYPRNPFLVFKNEFCEGTYAPRGVLE